MAEKPMKCLPCGDTTYIQMASTGLAPGLKIPCRHCRFEEYQAMIENEHKAIRTMQAQREIDKYKGMVARFINKGEECFQFFTVIVSALFIFFAGWYFRRWDIAGTYAGTVSLAVWHRSIHDWLQERKEEFKKPW